jgi:pimeloyl-ACP methyl ester carboxylesterase
VTEFVAVSGRRVEVARTPGNAPTLVFLHQGLGSVSMWRDFPARLAQRTGCGALVYSRLGHGNSDPEPGPRAPDYLLREGRETLPALLGALGLGDTILVGHSDGATIALAYLAAGLAARGAIVAAPHVFDEAITWRAIERQRGDWASGPLRARLQRHHRDADAMFEAWASFWLAPEFRGWSIVPLLATIRAPLLAVQGEDDAYGTMRQIDEIAAAAAGPVELAKLAACGHDPFRDQTARMLDLCAGFVLQASSSRGGR